MFGMRCQQPKNGKANTQHNREYDSEVHHNNWYAGNICGIYHLTLRETETH